MSDPLTVALVGIGIVLILAGLIVTRRTRSGSTRARPPAAVARGRESTGEERLAAPASEEIEELVNRKLAAIPGLAGTRVDFGTSADGGLEIWIGDEHYRAVSEIRDPRIREAVEEAVAAFNR